MLHYGFQRLICIGRKIKPFSILLSSSNIPIISLSHSNLQKVLKPEFIKRDFHKAANNYNNLKEKSKEKQDAIDNEYLQKLLEDSNYEKTYKLLIYEMEYLKQLNEPIPTNIRPRDWIFLIKAPTRSQQRKRLKFLFINEMKRKNAIEKKKVTTEKFLENWARKQESFTSGITYGLKHNSLFMRFYDKKMDNFYNYNLILSMLFEPKIVFDCGYEDVMSHQELSNCVKQLLLSFVANRLHSQPAHLYLCNAHADSQLMTKLTDTIPTLYEDHFPLDCTPKSYLDIFDKEKLVYLTPHCRTPMESYDCDKVYIIGALVDKGVSKPYSLAKAKKEGLRMEQLPLDRHLQWSCGSRKSLPLNHVLNILLDMKVKKDWSIVLNHHIPSRKQRDNNKKAETKK